MIGKGRDAPKKLIIKNKIKKQGQMIGGKDQ